MIRRTEKDGDARRSLGKSTNRRKHFACRVTTCKSRRFERVFCCTRARNLHQDARVS